MVSCQIALSAEDEHLITSFSARFFSMASQLARHFHCPSQDNPSQPKRWNCKSASAPSSSWSTHLLVELLDGRTSRGVLWLPRAIVSVFMTLASHTGPESADEVHCWYGLIGSKAIGIWRRGMCIQRLMGTATVKAD